MSSPPPAAPPPPGEPGPAVGIRAREITIPLAQPAAKGWRRHVGGADKHEDRIRLVGSDIVFEHAGLLRRPLTILAGMVSVAAVDREPSRPAGEGARFPILLRVSPTAVVPAQEGIEGWLWTEKSGSALPQLGEEEPNLALVFVKPLEPELVEQSFRPEALAALAARSALGAPTVFGLLARAADAKLAAHAFAELGVDRPLTDREVAPALRRHLPSDRPANPSVAAPAAASAKRTSIPPPPR